MKRILTVFCFVISFGISTAQEIVSPGHKYDTPAKFEINSLNNYIVSQLDQSDKRIQQLKDGDFRFRVRIDETGAINCLQIVRHQDYALARKISRIILGLPRATPAMLDGRPVAVEAVIRVFAFGIEPLFQGDDWSSFSTYVSGNVAYPEPMRRNSMSGRVVASFVVDKNGELIDITIVESSHEMLSREVIRVIRSAPGWTPGQIRGEPVKVKFTIPVNFRLY